MTQKEVRQAAERLRKAITRGLRTDPELVLTLDACLTVIRLARQAGGLDRLVGAAVEDDDDAEQWR